jgi:hypothetical protein
MSKEINNITTKRFVIRKSLIGTNTIITFVNKKNENVSYDHDQVYLLTNLDLTTCRASLSISLTLTLMLLPAFAR